MSESVRDKVTALLSEGPAKDGSPNAAELAALVYDELRAVAHRYFRHERPGHTLQPTAVVHEAYMRLVDASRVEWQGRTHFIAVGAKVMRRVLVDYARARGRARRGGGRQPVPLESAVAPLGLEDVDAVALNEALERLAKLDPRQARIVELRFFGGLSVEDVARTLDVSKRTVEGDWTHAKAWLRSELGHGVEE
jgi:RNA polymerase sigma factor (TIGR02999 family)